MINKNQFNKVTGKKPPRATHSQIHILPGSDHNMHLDNPYGLANLIINDLIEGAHEPVLPPDQYEDPAYEASVKRTRGSHTPKNNDKTKKSTES